MQTKRIRYQFEAPYLLSHRAELYKCTNSYKTSMLFKFEIIRSIYLTEINQLICDDVFLFVIHCANRQTLTIVLIQFKCDKICQCTHLDKMKCMYWGHKKKSVFFGTFALETFTNTNNVTFESLIVIKTQFNIRSNVLKTMLQLNDIASTNSKLNFPTHRIRFEQHRSSNCERIR